MDGGERKQVSICNHKQVDVMKVVYKEKVESNRLNHQYDSSQVKQVRVWPLKYIERDREREK